MATCDAAPQALSLKNEAQASAPSNRQVGGEILGMLTPATLATELGVAVLTLQRWRHSKPRIGPPYVRVGRRVFYRRAAVEAWLVAKEEGTAAPGKPPGRQARRGRRRAAE